MYHIVSSLLTPWWIIYFLGFSGSTFILSILLRRSGWKRKSKGGETNQFQVFPDDYNHIELLETFNPGATRMLCLKLF